MSWGPFFPLRDVAFQVAYPMRHRYFDVSGLLADRFAELYDEVFLEDSESELIAFDGEGVPRLRVGPYFTWWHLAGNNAGHEALAMAGVVWGMIADLLEPPVLDRVGARSNSVLAVSTVDEAVDRFKNTFFNYYDWPLARLGGTPQRVQLALSSTGIGEVEGTSIDASLRLWPIRTTEQVAADLGVDESEWGGGWLLDFDAFCEEVEAGKLPLTFSGLLGTSVTALGELTKRIEEESHAVGA